MKKNILYKQKVSYKVVDIPTRGKGLIASSDIIPETNIGFYLSKELIPIIEGRVLYDGWVESIPIARYANHSNSPNSKVSLLGNNIFLISTKVIKENEEITVDYIEVAELINLPLDQYDKYGIKDFDFKNTKLKSNPSLI